MLIRYIVDGGVRHVYCQDCAPDAAWLLEMVLAGRLVETPRRQGDRCMACGGSR